MQRYENKLKIENENYKINKNDTLFYKKCARTCVYKKNVVNLCVFLCITG